MTNRWRDVAVLTVTVVPVLTGFVVGLAAMAFRGGYRAGCTRCIGWMEDHKHQPADAGGPQ